MLRLLAMQNPARELVCFVGDWLTEYQIVMGLVKEVKRYCVTESMRDFDIQNALSFHNASMV
jgi:hypothetical protein